MICSMSAADSCTDNAEAESFFGVLERDRVNRRHYRTRTEARADIFDYIERGRNPRQRRRLAPHLDNCFTNELGINFLKFAFNAWD